jgi:hypothetical protein
MDFGQPHTLTESVATKSKIRQIPVTTSTNPSLGEMLLEAANQAAADLFGKKNSKVDSSLYPERLIPQSETIREDSL